MFFKLRTRRVEKKASRKGTKLSKESLPDLEPVLTMTMSQDEEEVPCGETFAHNVVLKLTTSQDIVSERTVTFTEKQVMENTLNQMRQLSEKHQQVLQMERQLAEKQERLRELKALIEDLKTACHKSLTDKDKEIAEARSQFEKALNEKKNEIVGLKSELVETKEKLVEVSSVLIGCQHELHEQSNSFWKLTSKWI
jgi:chromosome segregation ATPase